ncbi:MAG: YidC/Oxa1 family membrane protein insertase [Candidatus Saccharimonadales bacterium]
MFTTLIVQPIFNLLVLIYSLIPGHNFGLAIILFTVVIRLLMWPLVKKQLHHAKAMRSLAPELKKIKASAAGDRQKQSKLTMELYKAREINPFASLGVVLIQLPIFIGLYFAVKRLIDKPQEIIDFSYPLLHDLSWLKSLETNILQFDSSLFGIVDLGRKAIGVEGVYVPALILVALSAIVQYYQSKQLMPAPKEARSLRSILSSASQGKAADQEEVNAAVGRSMLILIPLLVFIFGLNFPAALPLYWLTSSFVAFVQQTKILRADAEEAVAIVATPEEEKATKPKKGKSGKSKSSRNRSRKRKRR